VCLLGLFFFGIHCVYNKNSFLNSSNVATNVDPVKYFRFSDSPDLYDNLHILKPTQPFISKESLHLYFFQCKVFLKTQSTIFIA